MIDISAQIEYLEKVHKERPIIGYFSSYVPEEIIAASGFHPYQFFTATGLVKPRPTPAIGPCCSFAKTISTTALHKMGLVDGVVFPAICDSLKRLGALWSGDLKGKYLGTVNTPSLATEASYRYFREELVHFARSLGTFFSAPVTEDALRNTARNSNETRRTLRVLSESRWTHHPKVTGSEMVELSIMSKIYDAGHLLRSISAILSERELRPINTGGKKRLALIGPTVDSISFLQEIEALGASIVCDDLMNETGSIGVDLNIGTDDIFFAIAKGYLDGVVSPVVGPYERWEEKVLLHLERSGAEGVLFVIAKSCELYDFSYANLRKTLKERGIPSVLIELEKMRPPFQRELTKIRYFLDGLRDRL